MFDLPGISSFLARRQFRPSCLSGAAASCRIKSTAGKPSSTSKATIRFSKAFVILTELLALFPVHLTARKSLDLCYSYHDAVGFRAFVSRKIEGMNIVCGTPRECLAYERLGGADIPHIQLIHGVDDAYHPRQVIFRHNTQVLAARDREWIAAHYTPVGGGGG